MATTPRSLELVKATLACLDDGRSVEILWNPASYRIRRANELSASRRDGGDRPEYRITASEARFGADLFLDTSENPPGPSRDARQHLADLVTWMRGEPGSRRAPRVLFSWGPFRFSGAVESLEEEWILFDPDGTPVRAWVRLVLRGRTSP